MSDDDFGRWEPEEKKYLIDPQVMKKDIFPKLDYPEAFGHIYQNIWHASNDMGDSWTEEKEPFAEKGLWIGGYPFVFSIVEYGHSTETDDIKRHAGPPFSDAINNQNAYVLESGRVAKVTTTKEPYDTGKSISCYGEYGTLEKNNVQVVDRIFGLTKTRLEGLIEGKIARNEALQKALKENKAEFSPYHWEGSHNGLYDQIISAEGMRKRMVEGEVNEKIFINSNIVPLVVDALSIGEKIRISEILNAQLKDDRMCMIPSVSSQSDDEDTRTVGSSAKYALGELRL
jgi:hypothetical protein